MFDTTKTYVAILEDNAERVAEMRASLAKILPDKDYVFFEDAAEMIDWLREHLGSVALISLDHDLPIHVTDGRSYDCGTGRQVVDYLATCEPICHVIVHTSNDYFAPGMCVALKDSGWQYSRVHPYDGDAWISQTWAQIVIEHV